MKKSDTIQNAPFGQKSVAFSLNLRMSLYNLLCFVGLLLLFPCWVGYLCCVPKARTGFVEKLGFWPRALKTRVKGRSGQRRLWFHAVSVGELNAIKTLIPELSVAYDIVISTTTQTGHAHAIKTFPNTPIFYCPFDLPWSLCVVLRRVQPDLAILIETELWPNLIDRVTRGIGKPLILINGRLSERSLQRYRWIRPIIRPTLKQVTHFYMQSQPDADRIRVLGDLSPDHVTVTGNLKFDSVARH